MNVKKLILVFVSFLLVFSLGFTDSDDDYPNKALFTRHLYTKYTGTILGDTYKQNLYLLDTASWQYKLFIENAFSPNFSKDGKTLVFSRYQDVYETHAEGTDIWVADSSGKNPRNITNTLAYQEYYPKISFDAKVVAYIRHTLSSSLFDHLCFIGIDGKNNTCIHDANVLYSYNCRIDGDPEGQVCVGNTLESYDYGVAGPLFNVQDFSWIAEAEEGLQSVVFHSQIEGENRGDEIYIATLYDGLYSGFYKIANGHSPEVSPDGRKISYIYNGDTYIFDLDTKLSKQIPENCTESEIRAKWSPDGSKIVTCYSYRGYESIALYNIQTEEIAQVMINVEDEKEDPYWLGNNVLAWGKYTRNMRDFVFARNLVMYNIVTKTTRQITDNNPTGYGDTISDHELISIP